MAVPHRSFTWQDEQDRTTLFAFVTLSMLLHLLVVLLFGTSPGTGASRGDTLWGRLEVTLRRLSSEPGSGFRLAPGAETTVPGPAILSQPDRSRTITPSRVEPRETPVPPAAPVAPAIPPPEAPPIESAPTTIVPPAVMPEVAPRLPAPSFDALPQLNLQAPDLVDKPVAPPSVPQPPAPPSPALAPSPITPNTTLQRELLPMPSLQPQLLPTPSLQPPEPALAPAETTPQKSTPVPQETPKPVEPLPQAMPTPIERTTPPAMERLRTPAIESPREVPAPAPVPAEPIAPSRIEPEVTPALPPSPRSVPAEPVAPPERIAPAREREPLPAAEPLPRSAPVEQSAPRVERAAPASVPEKAPAAPAPSRIETPSGQGAPQRRIGTPEGNDDIFKPRRDAITPAEPGAAPRLDLEATKKRAREIASEDYRGVIPAVPPPPIGKNKLGEAIAKAAKPDCRTAYAGMGLLAVFPLAAATVGDGGCRW